MNLSALKIGDDVAIYQRSGTIICRSRVTSTTPTRVTVDGKQYLRRTGSTVGLSHSSWCDHAFIEAWDETKHPKQFDEHRAAYRLKAARNTLAHFAWHSLTQEQADAVFAAMNALGFSFLHTN
jgi:hypothetical protein